MGFIEKLTKLIEEEAVVRCTTVARVEDDEVLMTSLITEALSEWDDRENKEKGVKLDVLKSARLENISSSVEEAIDDYIAYLEAIQATL